MKCNRRPEGGCCGHSSCCVSSLVVRVRMWAWFASVCVPAIELGHDKRKTGLHLRCLAAPFHCLK